VGDGGKGDKRRPTQISDEEMAKRWDAIFGKKDEEVVDFITPRNPSNKGTEVEELPKCKNKKCFCDGSCRK